MTDGLHTLSELAALLGVPVARISRLSSAGKIAARGRRRDRKLYLLSEVQEALNPTPDEPDTGLLAARELAAALGRSPNTIAAWIASGKLRPAGRKRSAGSGRLVGAYRLADGEALDAIQGREKGMRVRADSRTLALPPEPTLTTPGSAARIAVYTARVDANLACFHPQDSDLRKDAA